jgi:hypothetical protein
MSLSSDAEMNRGQTRRWVTSPWGILLLLGVLVVLVVGIVRLAHRYSPEGRLRSYVPESIRGTCRAEFTSFPGGGPM